MDYQDSLRYIYSFTNYEVTPATAYAPERFNLARVEQLLAALGKPHMQFQAVHIAGTKGKGSTAAMLESVLRAAGHSTALYTSPHLHTFRERIRVGGEMISQANVVAGVEKLKPLAAQIPGLTTFELITALAFDYFVSQKSRDLATARGVEIAVLEVGLGGRLDATNVVLPRVSVITSISYDHIAILGNTLALIAREKAGIIKGGVPVVTAPQQDEVLRVIEEIAREKNAPLITVTPDLRFEVAGHRSQVSSRRSQEASFKSQIVQLETWDMGPETRDLGLVTCHLPLLGRHQLTNATTALAAIHVLREQGLAIPNGAIRDGLASMEWQGRFEILEREPFFIVDGAHNADSAHQLAQTLRDLFPRARLHFTFGASSDKDIAGMFAELLPHATSLTLTRSRNPRAADPARLAELAARHNVNTLIAPDVTSALRDARQHAERGDVVCTTGSLFVVAEAREALLAEQGKVVETDAD